MCRKMTKAFQLKAITTPVKAFLFKDQWYPINNEKWNEKEIFIRGHGWKKYTATMRKSMVYVPNLPLDWTAQDIREVTEKFSLEVAQGLLEGWGSSCLFSDQSVGLEYAKHETANMAYFGKVYDEFTDKVHDLSQRFIKHLMEHGYRLEGAWLYYNDELVGQSGLYEEVWLSPLQHIDHLLKGIVHVRPMFDPMGFENMLIKLFIARPNYGEEELKKHISVRDRIKFLTTQTIADDFEKIFEWQKVFQPEDKDA